VTDALSHLEEGEFPAGSMGPKIEGAARFVDHGGSAIITDAAHMATAIRGHHGTWIVPDPTAPRSSAPRRWRHELAGPHAARSLRRQRAPHGHRAGAARPRGRVGVRGRHGHPGQPQRARGAGRQRRGGPGDVVVAVDGEDGLGDDVLAEVQRLLVGGARASDAGPAPARTLAAIDAANLALVSVPGEYATLEATAP
jgi:hypothetical protein